MTLDQFQTRLRAIFDATLARAVEGQKAHQHALDALFGEAEAAALDTVPMGGIVSAEVLRFHEGLRAAEQAAQTARAG